MGRQIPPDNKDTFTSEIYELLIKHGWYNNNGWREKSDHDRGYRTGLSEGQVVDELIRRDWKEYESDTGSN